MPLSDTLSHSPPATGAYPYSPPGAWLPGQPGFLAVGETYTDPVFGQIVKRLTNFVGTGWVSAYAKNGYWNANGTYIVQPTGAQGSSFGIYNVETATVVRSSVPWDDNNGLSSFAPDDPDAMYFSSGATLRKYTVSTNLSTNVKTFAATLGTSGGSVDQIDNTGRYFCLEIGIGIKVNVWDKQLDLLYSGDVPANFGGGWVGMAPDASGLVWAGNNIMRWHAIDHVAHTVDPVGVQFHTGGDHGDLIAPSNGTVYVVTTADLVGGLVGVVSINVRTAVQTTLVIINACDDQHFTGISRGVWRDWCVMNTEITLSAGNPCEDNDYNPPNPQATWYPFRQEIFMMNILNPGQVRRLAHHRSRDCGQYERQPKVCANWDGTLVAWSSSYGTQQIIGGINGGGYSDLYTVTIADAQTGNVTPPTGAGSLIGTAGRLDHGIRPLGAKRQ